MSVAQNIRRYMEQNDIKQGAVANKVGMRTKLFKKALEGKRKISIDEYLRICQALGQPAGAFILR